MWDVRFASRHTYSSPPGRRPHLTVGIGLGAAPEFYTTAFVDTGCTDTVFDGDLLVPLGFDRLAAFDPGDGTCKSFESANGQVSRARSISVNLKVLDDVHQMTVWGTLDGYTLNRNLLGLDFVRRYVLALDDDQGEILLHNLATNTRQITEV